MQFTGFEMPRLTYADANILEFLELSVRPFLRELVGLFDVGSVEEMADTILHRWPCCENDC